MAQAILAASIKLTLGSQAELQMLVVSRSQLTDEEIAPNHRVVLITVIDLYIRNKVNRSGRGHLSVVGLIEKLIDSLCPEFSIVIEKGRFPSGINPFFDRNPIKPV